MVTNREEQGGATQAGRPAAQASASISPYTSGLYHPDDLLWQVNREAVLLLSGGRALVMQLAHPLVAAGVAARDDFRNNPIGRLMRTLRGMLGIIYGDLDEADRCARRINELHADVVGTLGAGTSRFAAGSVFDALDPDLLLWVEATLTDSAMTAYSNFVRPLSPVERDAYYQQSLRLAPMLRVPLEVHPSDYPAFSRYLEEKLQGDCLEVTEQAKELAHAVLHPRVAGVPDFVLAPFRFLTIGMLPAALRARFEFPWDARRQKLWQRSISIVRGMRTIAPDILRIMPPARRAEKRLLARD